MLCKNCGYILSGKENFCPNCASPLKGAKNEVEEKPKQEKESLTEEDEIIKQEYIFPQVQENDINTQRQLQIFSEPDEDNQSVKEKEKNYAGRIMLLIFLTCAFAAGTFAVVDYYDLSSAVFSFVKDAHRSDADTVFDHKNSVIRPDKSLIPSYACVLTGKGIDLRKGPGKSYAPIAQLNEQTAVQVLGESLADGGWVYVYCDEMQTYGWLDAAFITAIKPDEENKNTTAAEATVAQLN